MQSRRHFLQQGFAGVVAFIAAGCSPSRKRSPTVPTTTMGPYGDFGDRIDVGPLDEVQASTSEQKPRYVPAARSYVSPFPSNLSAKALDAYPAELAPVLAAGLVVLYQRCTHLGCRVPWCARSEFFECPCHGAKFDRVGEKRAGPAPRGMDLMKASIENGRLVIDTATIFPGLPIGTNTTHQEPAGPYCV